MILRKFEILRVKTVVVFWWHIVRQFHRGKTGLNFVTKNFTTFFTARIEICHVELTLE